MSARRVPTPPTTELKFNYLNNPNKVLIENKDLQFLELGSEMRININTPKQQKDKFWNKINSRIENEMVKARSQTNYQRPLTFYTNTKELAEAQRLRLEEKKNREKWLEYNSYVPPQDAPPMLHNFERQPQRQPTIRQQNELNNDAREIPGDIQNLNHYWMGFHETQKKELSIQQEERERRNFVPYVNPENEKRWYPTGNGGWIWK
jgi:hypothetical protein